MANHKKLKFNPEKSPKTMCYVLEHDTFNIYCNRCGCPVLTSEVEGYDYQCMNCDEDLCSIETHKGEHHTDEQFNQLCLDTEAILELDEGTQLAESKDELDELRKLQNGYAASIGGVIALKEADDFWNDYNRKIIEAYAKVHPDCRIGKFHEAVQTPYTGQKIYNFGCDFIIPEEDEKLRTIIEERLLSGSIDVASLRAAQIRIETVGGIIFIWK